MTGHGETADPSGRPAHRACRVTRLPELPDLFEIARSFGASSHVVLLESNERRTGARAVVPRGRWSLLAVDPFLVFRSKRGECFAGPPGSEQRLAGAPLEELRTLLARYRLPPEGLEVAPDLAELPFLGGAMGYLGYELLYELEQIPDLGKDDLPVPDCYLMFFESVIVFDVFEQRSFAISNGFGPTASAAATRADGLLQDLVARLRPHVETPPVPSRGPTVPARKRLTEEALVARGIVPVIGRTAYLALVEEAKARIRSGDIFEICTCNRFDLTFTGSALELYGALRRVSLAPHGAYLRLPEVEVLSSSPERFLRFGRDRWAETRPIKGTRPRGASPAEDEALKAELLASVKDRAENIMIVDLARNDLGRVCEFGSVTVPELQVIESFAFTHQMVSTVRGRLLPEHDALDLIAAAFPGGSMTGAPKVEAMKIIDRLEPVKRGIFSGSIGYLGFDGSFDLSIVIRTFIKKGDSMSFHVGGAITSDSDPADEHQETLDKAAGLVAALDYYEALQGQRG